MNTYKYKVTLEVEVDAFDGTDAEVAVEDTFGTGESLGIRITDCQYRELANKTKRAKN